MQDQKVQSDAALLLSTNDVIFHLFQGKLSQKHDRKHHSEGRQTAQSHYHSLHGKLAFQRPGIFPINCNNTRLDSI